MNQIDFSNETPTLVVNMDIKKGGNAYSLFKPYTNQIMRDFTKNIMIPLFPEKFFTRGGLTIEEYIERIATHTDAAKTGEKQFFKGTWKNKPDTSKKEASIIIEFDSNGEAIKGNVSNGKERYTIDHLSLIANQMKFTFKTKGGTLLEIQAEFNDGKMMASLYGIEDYFNTYSLSKE